MNTLPIPSKLLKTLALAALLAPFACAAAEGGAEPAKTQPKKTSVTVSRKSPSAKKKPAPDPGWIGDCYYFADGGYYHKDGVYWRADMKTHYVYEEECWHLANGGVLTDTGVYFPPVIAPEGALGIPWRLAAVTVSLIAGPPENPGRPPAKPSARVITEARPSSGR